MCVCVCPAGAYACVRTREKGTYSDSDGEGAPEFRLRERGFFWLENTCNIVSYCIFCCCFYCLPKCLSPLYRTRNKIRLKRAKQRKHYWLHTCGSVSCFSNAYGGICTYSLPVCMYHIRMRDIQALFWPAAKQTRSACSRGLLCGFQIFPGIFNFLYACLQSQHVVLPPSSKLPISFRLLMLAVFCVAIYFVHCKCFCIWRNFEECQSLDPVGKKLLCGADAVWGGKRERDWGE